MGNFCIYCKFCNFSGFTFKEFLKFHDHNAWCVDISMTKNWFSWIIFQKCKIILWWIIITLNLKKHLHAMSTSTQLAWHQLLLILCAVLETGLYLPCLTWAKVQFEWPSKDWMRLNSTSLFYDNNAWLSSDTKLMDMWIIRRGFLLDQPPFNWFNCC